MRRGVKPKPGHLKLIEGTARADRQSMIEGAPVAPVARPKFLKGRAAAIWDEMIAKQPKWTEFQLAILDSFCVLKAEHERNGKSMPTARIVEMRRQAELLLAPRGQADDDKPKDPAESYFT